MKSPTRFLSDNEWTQNDDSGRLLCLLSRVEKDLAVLARAILHTHRTSTGFWSLEDIDRIAAPWPHQQTPPSDHQS